MNVFISAMSGEGNLGDDLISTVLVNKIAEKYPNAHFGILKGEETNWFGYNTSNITYLDIPRKKGINAYWGRIKSIRSFVSESDVLIVGGGGLLQDVRRARVEGQTTVGQGCKVTAW